MASSHNTRMTLKFLKISLVVMLLIKIIIYHSSVKAVSNV